MARKRKGIPGLSWSWKRAVGLSGLKAKVSRKIGVPLTTGGRQRKIGAAVEKMVVGKAGCLPVVGLMIAGVGAAGVLDWLL
jgi:hypothetical protein